MVSEKEHLENLDKKIIEAKAEDKFQKAKITKDLLVVASKNFDIDKVMAMLEEGMTSKLKSEEDKRHFQEGLEMVKTFLKGEASVEDYQEFTRINVKELPTDDPEKLKEFIKNGQDLIDELIKNKHELEQMNKQESKEYKTILKRLEETGKIKKEYENQLELWK